MTARGLRTEWNVIGVSVYGTKVMTTDINKIKMYTGYGGQHLGWVGFLLLGGVAKWHIVEVHHSSLSGTVYCVQSDG